MVTEEERRRIEEWYMEMAEHDRAQMIVDAREEGREEGREETIIQNVSNLMKNIGMDMESAMNALGIAKEDRIEIARRIGKV